MTVTAEALACRLCGSHRSDPALGELPVIRRCLDCGFVWRSAPFEQPVTSIYDDHYFSDEGYYGAYFARAGQWRFEARRRLRWLTEVSRPKRILEVGSAGGFFLEAAREAGIEAHGVELTPLAAAYAREQLGLSVTQGAFEEVTMGADFDAVCAFHVLEHVEDPEGFLEKARSLLTPNGLLALEVPNIDSARAPRDGVGWSGLVPDQHLWHFSVPTLARMLEGAAFVPVCIDTVFPRYYFRPARYLSRPGLAHLYRDLRTAAAFRASHPTAGDMVRAIARRAA